MSNAKGKIKITKPTDSILVENLIIVLYGDPGTGKSSLTFTADKPVSLDADLGMQRALNRKDGIRIQTWSEIKDITAEDLIDYKTIIIDTVGKLLDSMKPDILASNIKGVKQYATNSLAPAGFGVMGNIFQEFILKLKSFKKDIILIAHATEKLKNIGGVETLKADLKLPGKMSKEYIWEIADLMGYVYMENTKRMLDFNPTSEHEGKNCAEFPLIQIPDLRNEPNFLAELITQAKDKMNAKSAEQIKAQQEFQSILSDIYSLEDLKGCNTMLNLLKDGDAAHKTALVNHAKTLGFSLLKEKGNVEFIVKDTAKKAVNE